MAGLIITCDGGYRKLGDGPGVATYACLVRTRSGELYRESGVACRGRAAHSLMAEYAAVVAALRWLRSADLPPRSLIVIQSDCQSMVDRINGHCRVRRKHGAVMLHRLALASALSLHRQGHWVIFRYVPRKHVTVAHRLCYRAYSLPVRGAHHHLKAFLKNGKGAPGEGRPLTPTCSAALSARSESAAAGPATDGPSPAPAARP